MQGVSVYGVEFKSSFTNSLQVPSLGQGFTFSPLFVIRSSRVLPIENTLILKSMFVQKMHSKSATYRFCDGLLITANLIAAQTVII